MGASPTAILDGVPDTDQLRQQKDPDKFDAVDRGIAIVDKNHGYKPAANKESSSIT
ncbi:protein of unknown function [Cupriavidus taiwanensis]|uniref:hypothetical protein n=1 Tax=Cupriavidus taiwanensis TaxID=164546 RepID=UPI000E10C8AD|nr:hypothetical protein [Cupriavidus taiwanensis]SPA42244.1 protein of unknown function [Cupriavidus taiwanensis]